MIVAEPRRVPRGTALLFGVLASLAGYLWLFERWPASRPVPSSSAGPGPLLSAAPAAVARVDFAERGTTLTALRAGDGWTDPRGRRWPSDVIADLVTTLGSLRPLMVLDGEPHGLADYGFGTDAPRLAVADAAGRQLLALEVGDRNPAWTGLYVRYAGGSDVLLVGAVLAWEIEKVRAGAPERLTTEPKRLETAGGAPGAVQPGRDR